MGTNRTPTSAKTVRCKAVEGAQQCLSATHGKLQNHRWGPKGETDQWREDGTQKTPDPAADTEQLARDQFTEFTPDPALAAEARRLVAEEQARLAPDPHGPSDALAAKAFPTEAQREEQRQDRDIQRRAEIAAAVTQEDVRDMEAIRASHPDILAPNGPRPVSVSGAPGSRQADVISRMSTLALEGYPTTVQDEVIWTEIATHALMSMREEQARTKRHADPALVASAMDAVLHVAKARGLA